MSSPSRQRFEPLRNTLSAPWQAWLVHGLLVFTAAGITEWLTPGRDDVRPQLGRVGQVLLGPLSNWDGAWYLRIAEEGYATRQSTAFFPLYPLLIRWVSELTGVSLRLAGLAISNLAFLGALLLLHRLVRNRYGADIATRTTWLLALTPFGFFFSAVYTESLFLMLSLAALVLAREGRWTSAALALFLVTLTRSAGVFVAVPLAFTLIEQRGFDLRRLIKPGLQLAAGAAGPLVFAAHLRRVWDDPFLMGSIQSEWERAFAWPWTTLWTALEDARMHYIVPRAACTSLIRDGEYGACLELAGIQWDVLSDDFAIVCLVVAIPLLFVAARRMAPGESIYAALLVVFPLFNPSTYGALYSMPRYILVVWPVFVALAMVIRRKWLYRTVLVTSAAAMCGLMALHASSYFVS